MLTLFSIPKHFVGQTEIIQRNAIQSWTLLRPKPEIVLLGDDDGVDEICEEFNLIHIPDVEKNQHGTPLVSSIFRVGQEVASCPIVCYVNTDILLMSDFTKAMKRMKSEDSYLMVGQRWDVDIDEAWNFDDPEWEENLKRYLIANGQLHHHFGIDYFVFPKGFYEDIPPFAVGRFFWDQWLIYEARRKRSWVIDATPMVMAVHQNHGYYKSQDRKAPEYIENSKMASMIGGKFHPFTVYNATHIIKNGVVKPAFDLAHLKRRFMGAFVLFKPLNPLYIMAKNIRDWLVVLFSCRNKVSK